jgi:heme-degrading monooxygenase HmoA
MPHVRIWRFRPLVGREQEFASAYGPRGPWAELFGQADGYAGTLLLRPGEPGGWWLTIDRWESAEHFEQFGARFGEAYRMLDSKLEGVAGEEQFVGTFEED